MIRPVVPTAVHLVAMIEDAGFDAHPYSGRGMFGRQCVAFTADDPDGAWYDLAAAARDQSEYLGVLGGVRKDAMGFATVFYWPDAAWPDPAAETTEPDA